MEFRDLPQVDALSRAPELAAYSDAVRVAAARAAVDAARGRLRGGEPANVVELAVAEAERRTGASLRAAINLSGVILHTGLGRARLARAAADRVAQVARDYSALEFDLEAGERGDRQTHVRDLLVELTGAEAALVVNNAAAGVFLTLAALTAGGEVVLSRGQMVEIGGSFRMPDIVRRSGAFLVEVGCTNKTRLSDYREATGPDTAAWLRCHPSNFRVVGFTEEPALADLARAARAVDVLCLDDQGNGALVDLRPFGLPYHETLPQSVAHADVSIASGDKLLGGPQAGLVLGRRELLDEIARHPLARAVRVDKLTLAALEATLRLYATGRQDEIPTIRAMAKPLDDVRREAETLASAWPGASVEPGQTEVGSGSVPGEGLATWRVGLTGDPVAVARTLRQGSPPVVGRIEAGRVWLDPRTLEDEDMAVAVARLREVAR
jgi:L-seryl-tRNA(Ser) seleniumtransferase